VKGKTNSIPDFPAADLHLPSFLQELYERQASQADLSDPLDALINDEYISICRDFDLTQIQDSWSWRNTHLARELAKILIDGKGEIDKKALFKAMQLLEGRLYSLGPGRHHDATRQQHLVKILKLFYHNGDYLYALKRIHRPINHQGAERLIRETLFLPEGKTVTDVHARQAALSALLSSLRQNVGSCFATAPAILIQQDQPLRFLADIGQLFGTGRLTRVYEGIEYAVPLSVSWGVGDLFRPIALSSLGKNPFKILSFSPGLQAAFEAAALIDKKLTQLQRQKACEELLKSNKFMQHEGDLFTLITADQILKNLLLQTFGVTEKDVSDFYERSLQGPPEFALQAPLIQRGKGEACSRYLRAYDAAKWSFKALTDNALVKAWEFTLASLSESKSDFAKWNLYISLGVQPEEPNGIGHSLYEVVQEHIREINNEMERFQSNYDHLFAQAKYLEGRMMRGSSESDIGWVQAEYQIRRHEINQLLNQRDTLYEKGRKLQGVYPALIEFYGKKIGDYFQEIYDAEMHDISANPYDDSPAGFRLMYKHGRTNTALWTTIHSAAEYIQHLTSFFVSTEIEINQLPQFEGLGKEIASLITAAIMTVKRPEFLESSLVRLAKAYNEPLIANPLQNLDRVKRKPWSYISGGTMATLVSCYWGNPQKPQEAKRWVENENELLAFLIDTMKGCPLSVQHKYRDDPTLSMLAFSPTHAFLCKPGWKLFYKAWESDTYTYTWIRDHWVTPQQIFLDTHLLDNRMMELIVQQLLLFIPIGYRPIVQNALKSFTYSMTPPEFREHVMKMLAYEKWLHEGHKLDLIAEELDSMLYRFLPLFPEHALQEKLTLLFESIDEADVQIKKEIPLFSEKVEESVGRHKILTAEELKQIAKGFLISTLKETRSPINYHQKIVEAMQKGGLCYPEPILIADTNWVKNVFGFTLNPGTRNLEFWRFDESGGEGRPITVWKRYLNGISREEWGLYTSPQQYRQ
jgi:hypothetical protein